MTYVELHCRSAFSFLRAGSSPEELATEAARLELGSLALCDRDGFYGSVRLHTSGREAGLRAIVGVELTMEDESVVPLLVANRDGYRALCRLITTAKLQAPKGESRVRWPELAEASAGLFALTGDEDGPVSQAWRSAGPAGADAGLRRLLAIFGHDRLGVEIQRHFVRGEERENRLRVELAAAHRLPLIATNGVLHANPEGREVLDVFTCIRHHTHLDVAGTLLTHNAERQLKPAAAMEALFADLPEAVANTARFAEQLEFGLENLGYEFPSYPVPPGETMDTFLRKLTWFGAQQRYGSISPEVRAQLDRELALIARLGFAGYFLIVWEICNFCREQNILVQGRGWAANSAVCYSLGITAIDPVGGQPALRAISQRRPVRLAGYRSRPAQRRPPGARDPGGLPALRPARRGHDGQRHHLPRAQRHAGDRQGAQPARNHHGPVLQPLCPRRFSAHHRADGAAQTRRTAGDASPVARASLHRRAAPRACRGISASTPAA